jgi:riboflavin synthase
MSANPEDRLVTLLSRWLARHVSDDELRREVDAADLAQLEPGQAEAVQELRDSFGNGRGDLEMIVRELGRIDAVEGGEDGVRLVVAGPETAAQASVGDSVAIDGVCLTVVDATDGRLAFDAVPETLSRTTLGRLAAGAGVNLEPALRAGEPLGGHVVQGHVDGVGRVRSLEPEGDGARLRVEAPPEIVRYCVEKGSLTVAGVSLTVAELHDDGVSIALVPHTLAVTTLGSLGPGDEVNLEVDVLAKYVERLLPK